MNAGVCSEITFPEFFKIIGGSTLDAILKKNLNSHEKKSFSLDAVIKKAVDAM